MPRALSETVRSLRYQRKRDVPLFHQNNHVVFNCCSPGITGVAEGIVVREGEGRGRGGGVGLISSFDNRLASVSALSDRAVFLGLAATHAEDRTVGLDHVDEIVVVGTHGPDRSLHIVLTTAVFFAHGIELGCHPARDLYPVLFLVFLEMGSLDKALWEDLGTGGIVKLLGTERNSLVLILRDGTFTLLRGKEEAKVFCRFHGGDLTVFALASLNRREDKEGSGREGNDGEDFRHFFFFFFGALENW